MLKHYRSLRLVMLCVLKREPNEQKVNNYNASVMLASASHTFGYTVMQIDAEACLMYVASYIMTSETSILL